MLMFSALGQQPSPPMAPPMTKPQFQGPPDRAAMMYTPERATQFAHFQKLYYDALVKEGFSKEEAISIVRANPLSTR